MSYSIKICLFGHKCAECKHHKSDPERGDEYSCFLDSDLQGKERYDYLCKLEKHLFPKEK